MFKKIMMTTACLAMIPGLAAAKNTPTLKIENFIGTIDIRTGDFNKINVTDADGAPVDVTRNGVTIDAGYKINNANCRTTKSSVKIGIGSWRYLKRSGGYKDLSEYPKLKITAPKNTHLIIDQSVIFGDVEHIGSGDIHVRSCGDLNFDDVSGALNLRVSGSGDVKMGDAGEADISISGSGDLQAGDFASAHIHVSGSGDLELGDILGHAVIQSSGAGDVEMGRILGGFEYEGSGSSDFESEHVSGGDLSIRVSGSGSIAIDDGDVQKLYIRASGASDVTYKGHSIDAEARASGASDVSIRRPSGDLYYSDSGAGDVHISGSKPAKKNCKKMVGGAVEICD